MKILFHIIAASIIVFQLAIATFATQTLGLEQIDSSNSAYDADRVVLFKQDLSDMQTKLSSRRLELDATCSNACDSNEMVSFRAPFANIELDEESDDQGVSGRFFGRVTGFFKNSWTNGLFQFWSRRRQDDRSYLVATEGIVSLLSNSSSKITSLVDVLRLDGANYDASSSDFVQTLYDLSAENMESVVMVLDPILADLQRSEKIDIRTLGCHMTQISTLLRDVTLPNIEFIARAIYTNSGNADMEYRFNEYSELSTTRTSSFTVSNGNNNTCSVHDTSSAATTARLFTDMDIGSTNRQSLDFTALAENLVVLILYTLLFPISIVISLVGVVATIILLPFLLFVFSQVPKDGNTSEFIFLFLVLILLGTILSPVAAIFGIVEAIVVIFEILLAPLFPTDPPPDATPATVTAPPPTATPHTITELEDTTSSVMYRISVVLESPLDTIRAVFQSEKTFREADTSDKDNMECEIAAFMCKTTALLDVLPF